VGVRFLKASFLGPKLVTTCPRHLYFRTLGPADGALQLKGLALLAGRKLLLADDSVTIQKVIDLTFADEGVKVVTFSNGQDAIDHLEEIAPDIVLADVFMPNKTGYEVCEYVKNHEKLKRTPVMLLVGSFEPFDEAEARRVGANDILTKPFQSIRRLIDRVGALVNNPPAEKEVPTAELPKVEDDSAVDHALLNTQELEITTADTRPLLEDSHTNLQEFASPSTENSSVSFEDTMEPAVNEVRNDSQEASEVLLDLGDYDAVQSAVSDDFELDLEDTLNDAVVEPYAPAATPMRAFVEPEVVETGVGVGAHNFSYQPPTINNSFADTQELAYEDQVHELVGGESETSVVEPVVEAKPVVVEPQPVLNVSSEASTPVNVGSLPPEVIEQIARRAVAMLSEKVVQEIAWEVVPDLAELLIKRQLEEKESPAK
jgi:CheY-like chemotaxis protein